ncbi:MAG: hypothetical protein VXX30_07440, partial [Planctomycetota bacterium]|nr:hypothetical protein [Planctomycetota bacterium]
TFLQSYFQGCIVNAHRTRFITESVVIYVVVTGVVIGSGIWIQPAHGITVVMLATTLGNLAQTLWLGMSYLRLVPAGGHVADGNHEK